MNIQTLQRPMSLVSHDGPVHADSTHRYAVCGENLAYAVAVTDLQVIAFRLPLCASCFSKRRTA